MPFNSTSMNIFNVAGSAMTAQSQRMNATASNMANAESVAGPDGMPYRAKQVVFHSGNSITARHPETVGPMGGTLFVHHAPNGDRCVFTAASVSEVMVPPSSPRPPSDS